MIMKKNSLPYFKKRDFLIIGAILLTGIAIAVIFNISQSGKSAVAQIYYDSKLVKTVELSGGVDRVFSIPENTDVTFHLYPDSKICFENSNCMDKTCVKMGKLHLTGESAACLPNRILLKVVSVDEDNESDVDMVAK